MIYQADKHSLCEIAEHTFVFRQIEVQWSNPKAKLEVNLAKDPVLKYEFLLLFSHPCREEEEKKKFEEEKRKVDE